ncbi:ABC transporter permease subunit, partial [candidate division KSB1 bacterium]|nr:ABC transporter permease subunit [candidate division KSB1 bacterium]
MFKLLIEKELKEIIGSAKFAITFGVCAVLILLTFYVGAKNYQISSQRYEAAKAENLRQLEGLTDWLMVNSHRIFLPPKPLEALVTGVSNDIGRTIEMAGRGELTANDSRFGDDPIFAVFRFLDLDFVFQIVLSLFAILFAYDAINGEKERGTLRLSFANAIPRDKYILGKVVGSFLALAVPTAVLIWHANSQLKWEAFHQYRGIAEGLSNRIDSVLIAKLEIAEARSFADYTFLVVAGDQKLNFVQRSPLSEYPVTQDMHGVIGYFQVGAKGEFSTPLLPQGNADPATFGISADEYEQRTQLAQEIREILSDNRLVRRQQTGVRRALARLPASPADALKEVEFEEEIGEAEERQRLTSETVAFVAGQAFGDKDEIDSVFASPAESAPRQNEVYSQSVFDELNTPKKSLADDYVAEGFTAQTLGGTLESKERPVTLGKVADLKLDAELQMKSEILEKARRDGAFKDERRLYAPSRTKRKEQTALPEMEAVLATVLARQRVANLSASTDLRISTFESEVDPLEFSQLDSGHFVLFRKVWREGARYIQGILLSPRAFVAGVVDTGFYETGLSAMSNLIVAYRGDIIFTLDGNRYPDYTAESFDDALLYRSRLSAPFDGLELIFSINGLPPGPGATVLGW